MAYCVHTDTTEIRYTCCLY